MDIHKAKSTKLITFLHVFQCLCFNVSCSQRVSACTLVVVFSYDCIPVAHFHPQIPSSEMAKAQNSLNLDDANRSPEFLCRNVCHTTVVQRSYNGRTTGVQRSYNGRTTDVQRLFNSCTTDVHTHTHVSPSV